MSERLARMLVSAGAFACTYHGAGAQPRIVVRELAVAEAASMAMFGSILNVREVAGGQLLVNDGSRRQLVLLDKRLRTVRVVIDSVSDGRQGYGPRAAPLIPYLADSTLFVDGASLSLVVIDPNGKVARTMAAPRPADLRFLAGSATATDAGGNLIYRVPARVLSGTNAPGEAPQTTPVPDSASIVRARLDSRMVDTIARVRVTFPGIARYVQGAGGRSVLVTTINPLGTIDEWAVLSDGTIALVRGHDYHVDWLEPNGTVSRSPKLPFDFKRLSDADKQALIDSARADHVKQQMKPGVSPTNPATGGARATSAINSAAIVSTGGVADVESAAPIFNEATGARTGFVPLKEIPDYYPPIRAGAAKAGMDGRLWILPTTSAQSLGGELVYDVVSNRGLQIHRVRLPRGRSIAGFGRGGVVFLMHRIGNNGWTLERSRVLTE